MVYSSSSSIVKAIVVILLVLIGSSSSALAARPGRTASMIYQFSMKPEMEKLNYQQQDPPKPVTSFRYRGKMFGFLPKGSNVTPSGPSNRHNAVVDSTPKN